MKRKILGDFQTPILLARQILLTLSSEFRGSRLLEPTCGKGNFFRALIEIGAAPQEVIGIEIQPDYVREAQSLVRLFQHAQILQGDFFEIDLRHDIRWQADGPLLVIGNPPWVTNAAQTVYGGTNLPQKSNFKGFNGLDALTGKSNFDIAEYIWIKLIRELKGTDTTIALLCKTSVARNVMKYLHDTHTPAKNARLYEINAQEWFGAAVDACLFVVELNTTEQRYDLAVYESLTDSTPSSYAGFEDGQLIANVDAFRALSEIDGRSPLEWRQGVKHDAASVMELSFVRGSWVNKLGDAVDIEDEFIFPLVKSSDIQRLPAHTKRGVIIPQKYVGQPTGYLQQAAPKLWAYLQKHADVFQRRGSSIYANRPPFSIFGVGDYTFAEYKVLVSGFYKKATFVPVAPLAGKPIICDDTCYLLPFQTYQQAVLVAALLNHPLAQAFIDSLAFADSKRPITKALLSRIDLRALLRLVPLDDIHSAGETPDTKEEMLNILFPEPVRLL